MRHNHKINNQATENLSYNRYNVLGQITEKEVGRTSYNPLQHVKYKYNIRGWLYEINDINLSQGQLFFFGLKYNTGNIRFYNGNIGETIWKSASDNSIRKYNFNYDGLSRLRRAYYTNISKNIRGTFDVWVSYDENGNITYLGRNGGFESATFAPQIDKLYYTYKNRSNQLKKVVDLTNDSQGFDNGTSGSNDDYTYDAYGNMITDKNKGITNIVYNFMNLPVHIQFGSKGSIDYVYDASGAKQSKKVNYGSYNVVTYYVDGYQYEAKPAAQGGRNYSELLFFPTAEGYAKAVYSKDLSKKTPLSYKYVYIYKDHLGNNRMSYALDPLTGKAKILEENHYYPFGLRHQAYTAQARSLVIDEEIEFGKPGTDPIIITQVAKEEMRYKYKYNGKELQEEHGLNWYDYGARNYDAAVSHFWTIDPLAEKRYWLSPYNYVQNNPILRIDSDGQLDSPIYGTDGTFLGTDDEGLQGDMIVMNKEDFKQGMSHDEAVKKDLGIDGFLNPDIANQALEHYSKLPERPDYDGVVTFAEAIKHYNEGSGDPLFVDARKINLNATNVPELKADDDGYINFFPASHPNTGLVYGTIKLTLLNENTGLVRLGGTGNLLDKFDFDPRKPFGRIADGLYPGAPKNFNIYCTTCTTKIRTDAEVKQFREQIYKVISEHPKF